MFTGPYQHKDKRIDEIKEKLLHPEDSASIIWNDNMSNTSECEWVIFLFAYFSTGLRLYPRYHGLGASRDGVMSCGCHDEIATVEIKCPYKHKDKFIAEIQDKTFRLDEKHLLRRQHDYYDQVQMQLHVLELTTAYFVTWTTKEILFEKIDIERDWTKNMDTLIRFHKERFEAKFIQHSNGKIAVKIRFICLLGSRQELGLKNIKFLRFLCLF